MKLVAETFGVSRSQLVCRVSGSARRRGRYTKAELLLHGQRNHRAGLCRWA
jgi:hypothetical protein